MHPSPYTNNEHRRNKTIHKLIKENNIDEFLTEYSNIIFYWSFFSLHSLFLMLLVMCRMIIVCFILMSYIEFPSRIFFYIILNKQIYLKWGWTAYLHSIPLVNVQHFFPFTTTQKNIKEERGLLYKTFTIISVHDFSWVCYIILLS